MQVGVLRAHMHTQTESAGTHYTNIAPCLSPAAAHFYTQSEQTRGVQRPPSLFLCVCSALTGRLSFQSTSLKLQQHVRLFISTLLIIQCEVVYKKKEAFPDQVGEEDSPSVDPAI